ncbi:MAG: hypothetical protein KME60_07170 [Cyanomargarita calcarea GSE-NOS-MK-12-04C]|jgi:hypothetical protein|uniref:KGK family protein n=1 Tax=Cyanomargarita calcarea GSE-NOS-MK-12-04C TaxID=2839659 RepID=A0A951UTY3_9CYAN|nr:hypothetical protein [Cyanomargarita calcarea GSE-NOS-MK-12-04C]
MEIGLNLFDVVSVDKTKSLVSSTTFKVIEATVNTANRLRDSYGRSQFDSDTINEWGFKGVDCYVLQADGEGWKKGKVRLSLAFIPDETEEIDEQPPSTQVDQ